jgi:predicted dehydrogenase
MAQHYTKVLSGLGQCYEVIGRSALSAARFEAATGCVVRHGGLQATLEISAAPEQAIVAVGVEQLADVAIRLINAGTRRILLEKPGGLNTAEIAAVHQAAVKHNADVLIAYNRRFYESTTVARRLIAEDGGPISCTFEFTEWPHTIIPLNLAPGVKESWLLANSSHVVDLAIHLCGVPKHWQAWHSGALDWHPSAARFCGSGITDQGVLFSYHADWEAPGRWGVEVLTRKHRYIFRPMEQLHVVELKSVKVNGVELDDRLDKEFKPGLYQQTKAFLTQDDHLFCTLAEQLQHYTTFNEMAGYLH